MDRKNQSFQRALDLKRQQLLSDGEATVANEKVINPTEPDAEISTSNINDSLVHKDDQTLKSYDQLRNNVDHNRKILVRSLGMLSLFVFITLVGIGGISYKVFTNPPKLFGKQIDDSNTIIQSSVIPRSSGHIEKVANSPKEMCHE